MIKYLRETFGVSIADARKIVDLVETDPRYADDLALAAAAVDAAKLAVFIKGEPDARANWNYERALNTVGRSDSANSDGATVESCPLDDGENSRSSPSPSI